VIFYLHVLTMKLCLQQSRMMVVRK